VEEMAEETTTMLEAILEITITPLVAIFRNYNRTGGNNNGNQANSQGSYFFDHNIQEYQGNVSNNQYESQNETNQYESQNETNQYESPSETYHWNAVPGAPTNEWPRATGSVADEHDAHPGSDSYNRTVQGYHQAYFGDSFHNDTSEAGDY
jgi:hypothetical protein